MGRPVQQLDLRRLLHPRRLGATGYDDAASNMHDHWPTKKDLSMTQLLLLELAAQQNRIVSSDALLYIPNGH